MKVSLLLITFFLLLSCEVVPPGMSTDNTGDAKISLRNVRIECSGPDRCKDGSDDAEAIVRYYQQPCDSLDDKTEVLAFGTGVFKCIDGQGCGSFISNYQDTITEEGTYTLIAFVDDNQNESLDDGELYFCSDQVELKFFSKNVDLEINIKREFEE